jgi:hypothetical protein
MVKKVKKMVFGGISRAMGRSVKNVANRMPTPNPMSMAPSGNAMGAAPLPNATQVMPRTGGIASNALNAIRAAGAANPQMVAPTGASYGSIRPMPGAVRVPMKKGGAVGSASKRADGCAIKGKTKGRII